MKIVVGLVGSGKTTLYRRLNETRKMYAVEIELPQSCLDDDELKKAMFNLIYNNPNIECIIAHPYYLPNNFWHLIKSTDEVIYLDLPLKERLKRIKKRSKSIKVKTNIFPFGFIQKEERDFLTFKEGKTNEFI